MQPEFVRAERSSFMVASRKMHEISVTNGVASLFAITLLKEPRLVASSSEAASDISSSSAHVRNVPYRNIS